ncbi:MAG: hypothetical protein NTU61_03105, partial [Candidatus Altiarchaeota archaeon]|nr:hypothetical protein [Candidatus Altiarchaeota archaeon]
GGAHMVLNPEPRLLEHFGVAGKERVKMPFPVYTASPNNSTRDGVELRIHAVMDNPMPTRVKVLAQLGMDGVGLARMESELRYIGYGWTFTPGDPRSREVLRQHIFGVLLEAVDAYEKDSLPELKKRPFYIRLTDIRRGDPNKMPPVLSRSCPP